MTTPEGTAISKMLVLALQFSKGYLTTELVSRNATGKGDHEQSSTLRHERVTTPSKQKRRRCEPESATSRGTESLQPMCATQTDVPVHQQVCHATAENKRL